MDPDFEELGEEVLRERLETLLLFLRYGAKADDPRTGAGHTLGESLSRLTASATVKNALSHWQGIPSGREVILLTSLAPGADTIAADVVSGVSERDPGFHGRVHAVLPFPAASYRTAPTFVSDPDNPDPGEKARQAEFDSWMKRLPDDDIVVVRTSASPVNGDFVPELDQQETLFEASGHHVAENCEILVAIYDDRFDTGIAAGSNQIVEFKRRSAISDLVSYESEAEEPECRGPVFHIYHPRLKTKRFAREKGTGIPPEGVRSRNPFRILPAYSLTGDASPACEKLSLTWEPEAEVRTLPGDEARRLLSLYQSWQDTTMEDLAEVANVPVKGTPDRRQ
jgi:hypothetical protein